MQYTTNYKYNAIYDRDGESVEGADRESAGEERDDTDDEEEGEEEEEERGSSMISPEGAGIGMGMALTGC